MIAHWSACTQFFVVYLRDFPEKSWPVLLNIQDSSWIDQYIWAIFRSLSHMITIGYGRDPPQDTVEVWSSLVDPVKVLTALLFVPKVRDIINCLICAQCCTCISCCF